MKARTSFAVWERTKHFPGTKQAHGNGPIIICLESRLIGSKTNKRTAQEAPELQRLPRYSFDPGAQMPKSE